MKSIIRNFIAKKVAGRSDDGIMITLSDPKKVDFQAAMLEDLLMRNGIDPNAIKSEEQLKMLLNQIDAMNKQSTTTSGIRNTESAKVFDLEGKEIPKGSKIMGGKAVDDDLPPPGSRGGDEDIAAPVQSQEETLRNMTEAEIKREIEQNNKSAIENILKRKNREDVYGIEDYDTTNMSEIKKQIIKLETRLGNLNPELPGFRDRARVLVDEIEKLKGKMRDDKADGGRIGLKVGTGKRFLQRVFGKEKFEEMKTRDPEMYVGLLEVVDMYRKRDKEGLKMYLQKFLPHMDDEAIEAFIIGSDGTEGLIGELIRLGSGRDYQGKIEMIKKAERMRKLDDLEITDDMIRKPNADGGRIGYKLGTGIESAIAENKKLEENIATQRRLEKYFQDRLIKSSPFGILMDREPPNISDDEFIPPSTLDKSGKDVKIQKLPFKVKQENTVLFSDGTVYYKDTGEFYDENLGKVTGPSPGAKPVRRTEEAKDGGIMRLGLKDGMNRRTFLKLLTGLAAVPIIGKVFKPLKVGKKVTQVPIIKTGDVPGKPEWFDQLVNKVILEGDDVTKRFATQERQVIHMKKIDDETSVTVTQDLNDGSIMVDVDDPIRNVMGESGDDTSVQMLLKKNPGDESNPAGADEFSFTEADMRNYMDGPDDYTTEFTENTVRKMKDLTSDLGKIKSYATGKKQTMKEFIESKKRQDMVKFAEDNPAEYAAGRGPEVDYDPEPDFAKGGIARMLGE